MNVAASVFSDELDIDEKAGIAAKILAVAPATLLAQASSVPASPSTSNSEQEGANSSQATPTTSSAPSSARNRRNDVIQPTPSNLVRGKPPLPSFTSSSKLVDFVSPRSIIFFIHFCPNFMVWLTKNPPWNGIFEFEEAKAIVRGMTPVNDPAERLCATAKRYKVIRISFVYLYLHLMKFFQFSKILFSIFIRIRGRAIRKNGQNSSTMSSWPRAKLQHTSKDLNPGLASCILYFIYLSVFFNWQSLKFSTFHIPTFHMVL